MAVLSFFFIHWYLSIFVQTFFHHRYAAHANFKMSKFWEKFFHIFSFISQGSSYLSPYTYGVLHRMHHAYTDTEKDPHSPKYDHNPFAMMWRTRKIYNEIDRDELNIRDKFTKGVPKWRKFDFFASNGITRLVWIFFYVGFYVYFDPHWAFYLLIPIHIVMGAFHGVIINWYAHKYGYTNFKLSDTSKNLIPIDIIMMGEGLHNNHHKFGGRLNFGVKWWEFDPTYYIAKFLHFIGVIEIRKKDPLDYM